MQAKLEASELGYLLQTHGAQRVAGLTTERFFPQEEATREAMLAQGFAALVDHGWLVAADGGYRTNTSMMLLSAVVATPERLLMVTRVAEDGVQILTYSWAQQFIVEMFEADDRNYILTNLESNEAVIERLRAAFQIADTHTATEPIKLPQANLALAFTGTVEEKRQFWRNHLSDTHESHADNMAESRRRGLLTQFVYAFDERTAQADLIILEDKSGKQWALIESNEQVMLYPLTVDILQKLLESTPGL